MTNELKIQLEMIKLQIQLNKMGGNVNKKQLRDILDVTEGLLRNILNSKGNYNHQTLKSDASVKSVKALEVQKLLGKGNANSKLHREHALPMDMVIPQLMAMTEATLEEIATFLKQNLLSVLITKDEMKALDYGSDNLKKSMPANWDGKDNLARFKARNIELV